MSDADVGSRPHKAAARTTPRIAVIGPGDPLDVECWSGTPFHMTQALRKLYPDLVTVRSPRPAWLAPARRAVRRATGGGIDISLNPYLARRHARAIGSMLRQSGVEFAICIAVSPLSAFLADAVSTIHVSDATVPLMRDYYREFRSMLPFQTRAAVQLDKLSVLRASASLFCSDWAAQSAIGDYGAQAGRVHVVPFGANVTSMEVPSTDQDDCCRLVFVGRDWQRKGGDIAVAAFLALRARLPDATLDIVGASPALTGGMDGITVHGSIAKGTQAGLSRFNAIMRRASFVLVPTRQECFGMFATEASAFGIPVISTRTGGMASSIREGVNGCLLPPDAQAKDYAATIASLWADQDTYRALRRSALALSRECLNWDRWACTVAEHLDGLAQAHLSGPV